MKLRIGILVAPCRRWMRASPAFVLATATHLALAGVLLGSWLAPAVSAAPDPEIERDLVALTNVDRTSNGLSSLIEESVLVEIGRERSADMVARNYFSHDIPPDGEKVFAIMDRRRVPFESAGENLAWNNAGVSATVQHAEKDFMNSPTHRANIMRGAFTRIGVGAEVGADKTMFTVLFMKPFD